MNKIALFPYQSSAVGFYRILQPGRVLVREKLFKEARSLPFSGDEQAQYYEFNDQLYLKLTENADILWSTVVYKPEYITKFLNLREHNTNRDTKQYCKTVFDMDDNLYAVPIDNPVQQQVESLKHNFQACLQEADGVTVSTPQLKKLYEKINPNIYINPNGIDFNIWDKLKTKHTKKIRIGWRGAFGHRDDLELIRGALTAIMKDYDVTFVTLGWGGFKSDFPVEKHQHTESIFDYPDKLASLNLDLAIVPLVDSAYNRCKSNIAYLEYSALKIPTVLSPVENQKGMVALEAQSNFEWYQALEKLIKDKEYRLKLGEDAYKFVKENYDIKKLSHPLAKWFEELKFRDEIKPPKK